MRLIETYDRLKELTSLCDAVLRELYSDTFPPDTSSQEIDELIERLWVFWNKTGDVESLEYDGLVGLLSNDVEEALCQLDTALLRYRATIKMLQPRTRSGIVIMYFEDTPCIPLPIPFG